ncbi:homeobox protein 12-like [Ostrinia furnacalis]|uniref:homeobox protein 12-like n=1 Tax=Ostrinia furnacalis TaxID=93504 RepID=UPI00103A84A1|nr:homeobox protein 12-like [Ostrinia furnacalis]
MGGSKCTYRNCSVRSGTKDVHMFHYPVYDKKRCHQWLVNAQKFEFLNLKVSQLRNRIVCQHHFKDECFMNYLKERLTHYAIPTEDGPYCDSSNTSDEQSTMEANAAVNVYSLILNDSENVPNKYVNKSKSSIIYADFLTNGDTWEKQSLNETIWNNKVVTNELKSETKSSQNTYDTLKEEYIENTFNTLPTESNIELNTKISEFENATLPDISTTNEVSEQITRVSTRSKRSNKGKKPVTDVFTISNNEFKNLLDNQGSVNVITNQETYNNIPLNQDLNELLLNQENNNMIANMNNFNTFTNVVIEQPTDLNLKWPQKEDHTMTSENNYGHIQQPSEIQYPETSTQFHENMLVLKGPSGYRNPYDPVDNFEEKYDIKDNCIINNSTEVQQQEIRNQEKNSNKTKKPKIKILCDKKITGPIKISDKLEPVPVSLVIPIKKEKISYLQPDITNNTQQTISTTEVIPKKVDEFKNIVVDNKSRPLKVQNKKGMKIREIIPKPPAIKNKISPERVAAIEKKRNFNKKLRDIIETCLEKLDEHDKNAENVADSPKRKELKEKVSSKQNIGSYLSKEAELPDRHEYTMKFIEARMQRMENILIDKIDQNSKKIAELQKCVNQKSQPRKSTATQTSCKEESYKKQLYQELSKFLSPDANSLIYEELFINKYDQKNSNQPAPKRRKRR